MKYGIWNTQTPVPASVNELVQGGYPPLVAMILAARGIATGEQAAAYLDCAAPLEDPFWMLDMDAAAERLRLAIRRGERVAVYGDYDVDGVSATCLLLDFLRSQGCDCRYYIPGRQEEGYGLNPSAVHALAEQGVQLIVTVDCGITAVEEARLCRALGIDLVITDHHACKDVLPQAAAVVDPHRQGDGYPHKALAGVGVAFKLACAISGRSRQMLDTYADLVCLGTVADVMSLQGENRTLVSRGLEILRQRPRCGLAALMDAAGCDRKALCASTVGFVLAPRINAAGRMGQIDLAVELFLTGDPHRADILAHQLCELNRQRQNVESQIFDQALAMLPQGKPRSAIVLAREDWHQGVIGIVASRMAEEFCCPTFLICLEGQHGKASSRSYGGFNLFASLSALSPLLESYGGHELAAGFTISRENIDDFRRQICAMAGTYYADSTPQTEIDIDCAVDGQMLTLANVASLDTLEPCGCGCPKPVLMMERMRIERISPVGGGRHTRLLLRQGHSRFGAIFFSVTPQSASISQGDLVDVAFTPQINDFRGSRSVQLNVLDIRPSCSADCSPDMTPYLSLRRDCLTPPDAAALLPCRATLGTVWRFLATQGSPIRESPMCLCRKIVRWSGTPLSLGQLLTCLDIFREVGLLDIQRIRQDLSIRLTPSEGKTDLNRSQTMQRLLRTKES